MGNSASTSSADYSQLAELQNQDVIVNIAVTGEAGSGKSAFINALRGLSENDDGAAKTGVTETTMEPTKYSHPSMPNVFLWDLPGMATPNFQVKTYLKNVMLKTYDFFIIVASERFKVNHLKLATEIKKMKKRFYFVRSKIDNDAKTEALRGDFNEERMLTEIRQECEKNLKEVGELKVFLVSSFEPENYEFQKLVDALKEVFDQGLKRGATSAQRIALTAEDFQGLTAEEAITLSEENLRNLNAVTINIAVTGETGSGKSSFINAWRGLCNNDDGAAKTGVTETTMEPTRYSHPSMSNVYLWDLPGIGTSTFNPKKYLKDVRFETYDFFIIISSERFKVNNILLAKNIKKMKKLFYFVRSKIDNDVTAESRKRDFNEEQMLTTIREDCEKNLKVVGDPKVFLVSSFELEKFDFQKLISTLEEDLDEDMGSTLIQSLPVCSLEMIKKKTKRFNRIVLLLCFASAGVAMIPVPGLSVATDISIVTSFFTSCYYNFGLNEKNLRMLSTKSNMSVAELKDAMQSIFANGITKEVVIRFAGSAAVGVAMTLEFFLSTIPIIGTLMAGGLSFTTTHIILSKGLQEMSEAAKRMLMAAGFT